LTKNRLSLTAALFFLLVGTSALGQSTFAYTDTFRVYTLEFKAKNLAIVNVINLTDSIQILEPSNILVIKNNGEAVVGQVYSDRTSADQIIYTAVRLIPARSFMGSDLLGAFHFQNNILKVYVSQGGRYFELASLMEADFESLLSRLSQLDLETHNVGKMFEKHTIPDLGLFIPFKETEGISKLFEECLTPEGINPPRTLLRPLPRLTKEARKAGFKALVEITAGLNQTGAVTNITFESPPPYGMAKRIKETIRNSWHFLPATYNGEIVSTEIKFTISYGEESGTGKTQKP